MDEEKTVRRFGGDGMGRLEGRCKLCGHRDEVLHSGHHLLERMPQDVRVQKYIGGRVYWSLVKAGALLCIEHPRLHVGVKPEEAMTPSNPRWQEFAKLLESRLEGKTTPCKAGRDKTQATAVMKEMGLGEDLISVSRAYFESHGGFCDCEIIYNIVMVAARI
jgi:hypothetical protein